MKNNKKDAQTRHAKQRAMDRYDIDFTQYKRETMIRQINIGEGRLIRKQSHRVSIYLMTCDGKEVVVVYDKERNNIASFLPIEAKDPNSHVFMGN